MKNERTEIRDDLRQVLKRFSREELLAQLFQFSWGKDRIFRDYERLRKAQTECSGLSEQQLIERIIDRDVEETYKFRHSRV
jgi:hypothetical protein